MHASPRFEELDYQQTPLGEVILRRRTMMTLDDLEVYEIMLGADFLMSSLFTVVEEALSDLGLAACEAAFPGEKLDVVVGGLGLGYTAQKALDHHSVVSLTVVDYLKPVIEWHEKGLVPLGEGLTKDGRCHFEYGDFFKRATAKPDQPGFDASQAGKQFHAVLLDIDHSPDHLLNEQHAHFYQPDGLRAMTRQIHPGGVFALWSDDPPEASFMNSLNEVFAACETHVVPFTNPILGRDSESTVYVCRTHG
ncbi:spermidine synthase [Verrucomicrobiaceae bacterium N1E253]|uniref:Spermidine synthase n=1 Tax=Oceaniferula marina TaxID=2748318 RepID=A0A851GEH2_9BACT|nr:spermidine synthase [Oceaniferula marina]NWK55579.1 spermidine synthase [Oceaniferula marina]